MDYLNIEFLEEYKRLDKLCRDIYCSNKGVSNYIEEMKSMSACGQHTVNNWAADLRQLIYIRNIRNQLAHDIDTMDCATCTDADIDWISNFHSRILNQTDPLSILHKCHKQTVSTLSSEPMIQTHSYHTESSPYEGCLPALFIVSLLVVFIILVVFAIS